MFQVKLTNNGQDYWLSGRGTWRFFEKDAAHFDTASKAQSALDEAKPRMKRGMYQLARIIPV